MLVGWIVGYDCSYFVGWVGSGLYVCGLGWVVGYENRPMDNSGRTFRKLLVIACALVSASVPRLHTKLSLRVHQ